MEKVLFYLEFFLAFWKEQSFLLGFFNVVCIDVIFECVADVCAKKFE